jgi:hypothetical protein
MTLSCDAPLALFSPQQMLLCPEGLKRMLGAALSGARRVSEDLPLKAIIRAFLFVGITSYLLYQLSNIGWNEIWGALPTSPLFYALSLGFVLAPVVAEVFAYQTISERPAMHHARLFLRKHVLNKAVMNFSGDAYFVQKLSQQQGMNLRRAAIILKDMTIIRAFVANSWIVLLAAAAIALGKSDVLQNIAIVSPALVMAVSVFCLSVIGTGLILFRKLTRLKLTTAAKVAAIYVARSCVVGSILVTQWSLAIPGNAVAIWFVFLIVFYITKKSPVGGELVFASVVVSLPGLGGDTAAVAAMLIAIAAVAQILYVVGFIATFETGFKRWNLGR